MRHYALSLSCLCSLALSILPACSVDLSPLRARPHNDASLDVPTGNDTGDAIGKFDEGPLADLQTTNQQDAETPKGFDGAAREEAGVPAMDGGVDQSLPTDGNSDMVMTFDVSMAGGEDTGTSSTLVRLTGTTFGSGPAWLNGSTTFDKAFDGDISTFDDDSNVSGGYTGIDLGAGVTGTISVIRYYPRPAWNDRLVGGKFQCSTTSRTDGYSDLYTIAAEPPLAWTQVAIANTARCRYLRYLGPSNGLTNIAEVEFWGASTAGGDAGAPSGGTSLVNLAFNKPTMASSQAPDSNFASYGNDGSLTSEFCPASGTFPDWWMVDLGTVYALVETDINFEHPNSRYQYKVEASTDGASWTTTVDVSNNSTRIGGTMTDATNVRARYVRLSISGSSVATDAGCFREFLVWGYNADAAAAP
jgi:hypothetical protein